MKKYARLLVISLISFLVVAYYYPGFSYSADTIVLFLAAGIFALLNIFVKPILKLLSLPFNLLTFGFFSFLVNVIVLYGVSYAIPKFKIISFHFSGYTYSGFSIPSYDFNQLLSALLASLIIGISASVLHWIFR
jgi:putative membrane protein